MGVLTNTGLTLELALFFGVRRCRPIAAGALALMLVAIGAALGFPLT